MIRGRKIFLYVVVVRMRDQAEAEVALVVKDRAAAREPARQENPVTLHQRKRAFGGGALVFSDDDRLAILPEKENWLAFFDGFRQIFLRRKMQIGVAVGRPINRKAVRHRFIIHGEKAFVKKLLEKMQISV